jgi:hypothetical protein
MKDFPRKGKIWKMKKSKKWTVTWIRRGEG